MQKANSININSLRVALDRQRIIVAWEKALAAGWLAGRKAGDVTAEFMERERPGVSLVTLYAWRRDYRQLGLEGLFNLNARRKHRNLRPFLAKLKRLYIGPGLLSLQACYLLAAKEAERNGWEKATVRESRRFITREVLPSLTKERSFDRHRRG